MARNKNKLKAPKPMNTTNQPPNRWQAPWLPIGGTPSHLSVVMITILAVLSIILLVGSVEAHDASDTSPIHMEGITTTPDGSNILDTSLDLPLLMHQWAPNDDLATVRPGQGLVASKKKSTKSKEKVKKPKEGNSEEAKPTEEKAKKKPSMVHWAVVLMRKNVFMSIADQKGTKPPEIFMYRDGVFVPATIYIMKRIQRLLGHDWTTHKVKEILEYIWTRKAVDRKDIDPDPMVYNLKNGLLNVDTFELKPHTHEYLSLVQSHLTFDPEADCPVTKNFLSGVIQKKDQDAIQEFFGYTLWKEYINAIVLLLNGWGRNGKTTFINLLKAFLGEENTSSVDIHDFNEKLNFCA
jgi:phage/plasmid-associated DNA primase